MASASSWYWLLSSTWVTRSILAVYQLIVWIPPLQALHAGGATVDVGAGWTAPRLTSM